MDVTLFELHLPDAEFNAPFAGRGDAPDDRAEPPSASTEPTPRLGPLAGLLGLVGLALLARYLRGSEPDQTTLDEVEA